MSTIKRIVCLANSRKLNGRCIAGIELTQDGIAQGWIRPVSAREHEEVSEYERQYEDGSDPKVLDVIEVPLLEHRPNAFQEENWLLDPQYYWVRVGRIDWGGLAPLATPIAGLWVNGHHTYNGLNDSIPLELAATVTSSLCLIRVSSLQLHVFAPGEAFGNSKRRVQGHFRHQGTEYRLWVTDPVFERCYLAKPNGYYALEECFLTVSLGEPLNGVCYKLIAAIIPRT